MAHGTRLGAGALSALLLAAAASAEDPARRGFDPDAARLSLGALSGFTVETASPAHAGNLSAEVLLDYAEGLLALRLPGGRFQLLESRLSAHVLASYSLGWLEIGAALPVALAQDADLALLASQGITGPLVAPVARTAVGDARLVAKVSLLDAARAPIGAAAVLDLRAPTGSGGAFYSDGPMAVPSLVASRAFGRARLDAQLGYAFRRPGQYMQLVVHDGVVWGAGASLELPPLAKTHRWRAILELTGGWQRGNDLSTDRYRSPLEARGGVRVALWKGTSLDVGGGTGIGDAGYGRPSWRVFVGLGYGRLEADRDGDGVPDEEDWCPDLPGLKELHGCPDEDTDGDGVPNRIDLCPLEKGSPEMDGCPDSDGDGIPDREDRCPHEPGPPQNEGCPIGEEPVVEIETERLSLKDAINFDTGKDTLKHASFRILDTIAQILGQHGEIQRVRVEGHTDNVGGASYNRDLSQRRANTVVTYLASKGVARDRLVPKGYGFDRPVVSNATAGGRAKNRRVEFTILHPGAAEPADLGGRDEPKDAPEGGAVPASQGRK